MAASHFARVRFHRNGRIADDAGSGGGGYMSRRLTSFTNCEWVGNWAASGSAIHAETGLIGAGIGAVIIDDCLFRQNVATVY